MDPRVRCIADGLLQPAEGQYGPLSAYFQSLPLRVWLKRIQKGKTVRAGRAKDPSHPDYPGGGQTAEIDWCALRIGLMLFVAVQMVKQSTPEEKFELVYVPH